MTAIYKTGTVSVNNGSNIVTGNGTSFIDVANVQEGDLFTVDGQKFYEAYEIDTNTQIKIRNIVTGGAFAETNVTAGNFAIIRNFTSQTSAEIAAKVLAVQQKWMNREEEMTDWFYTANDWATVTSINGDQLSVMTPNGINNLLAPGAFGPDCSLYGVGSRAFTAFSNWNTIPPDFRGFMRIEYNAANPPEGIEPLEVYQGVYVGSSYSPTIKIWGCANNRPYKEYDIVVKLSDDSWEGTPTYTVKSEQYHSNNLNPNSFGLAANDLVGKGSAASATVAVFELPLVSTKAPTSLSVTGTFKIKNPASGSDLITGISAATIANALNSSSSDRWAYIVLSGLTGLTFNHALHLVGETADANIKVNF